MGNPASKLATAADLLRLGEAPFEVLGGELVEKAAPSFEHSDAQLGGGAFLRSRFHGGGGGDTPGGWWLVTECEIELETHEVFRPDLVGWRRTSVSERPRGRPVRVRPDWVCEILSPSNARTDLVHKLRAYQRAGVPHYWIVDPQAEVLTVYRHSGSAYEVALTAGGDETVHAEPFEAVALPLAVFWGNA
jgi:Uma2 family endonuclease